MKLNLNFTKKIDAMFSVRKTFKYVWYNLGM